MEKNKLYWPLSKLKLWPRNPRVISSGRLNDLKESLQKEGQLIPLLVDTRPDHLGEVLGGNMTLTALRQLEFDQVWVELKEPKNDAHAVELALKHNMKYGRYVEKSLVDLIKEFKDELDLDSLDVDIKEPWTVKGLLEKYQEVEEDVLPEPETPTSKVGQMWQLGSHRLMCGDATDDVAVDKLMGGGVADMVFTDPPYNVDYKSPGGLDYASKKFGGGGKIFSDALTDKECLEFYSKALKSLYRITSDSAPIYWWFASKNVWISQAAFKLAGWHMSQVLIWLKNSMIYSQGQDYHRVYEPCMFGWKKGKKHYRNNQLANWKEAFHLTKEEFAEILDVWYQARDITTEYLHPTQKPVALACRALKKSSQEGNIVVDFFGGSGSTLIACEQMKRSCYTMELDPKFCDVILLRWQKLTGLKPKLLT